MPWYPFDNLSFRDVFMPSSSGRSGGYRAENTDSSSDRAWLLAAARASACRCSIPLSSSPPLSLFHVVVGRLRFTFLVTPPPLVSLPFRPGLRYVAIRAEQVPATYSWRALAVSCAWRDGCVTDNNVHVHWCAKSSHRTYPSSPHGIHMHM